jgi:hypothetical protein
MFLARPSASVCVIIPIWCNKDTDLRNAINHNSNWKRELYIASTASSLLTRPGVLTEVNIKIAIVWDVTPCSLVYGTNVPEHDAKMTTYSTNER